jgi:multidrug efflux system membrane fusion protein
VTVKPAETGTIYSGEVRARYETDLAFRVGGKVVARNVDVGAIVAKGAPLARLDPQDAQLAVDAARSQLAAAEADHALAKAELERYRELHAKNFVSKAVLDARVTTFETTRARLDQARAQLSTSRNQSSYTSLVAESDGVITAVNLEPGQVVATGQPVMRLAKSGEREVAISVPESRLGELREANEIQISIWAQPDKLYRGRIREIAPNADPVTRTFLVKISLLDPDAAVKLGMTANVAFGDRARAPIILLPLTAVADAGGQASVWVFDPATGKVNPRPVEVDAYREDGVAIRSGVKPGEVVVTQGVHKLLPGETVRLASGSGAAVPGVRVAGQDK